MASPPLWPRNRRDLQVASALRPSEFRGTAEYSLRSRGYLRPPFGEELLQELRALLFENSAFHDKLVICIPEMSLLGEPEYGPELRLAAAKYNSTDPRLQGRAEA